MNLRMCEMPCSNSTHEPASASYPVVRGKLTFPSERSKAWGATPDGPARIAQLGGLLEAIENGERSVATTTLGVVSQASAN